MKITRSVLDAGVPLKRRRKTQRCKLKSLVLLSPLLIVFLCFIKENVLTKKTEVNPDGNKSESVGKDQPTNPTTLPHYPLTKHEMRDKMDALFTKQQKAKQESHIGINVGDSGHITSSSKARGKGTEDHTIQPTNNETGAIRQDMKEKPSLQKPPLKCLGRREPDDTDLRPRGLRLVFMGDSVTRFQYISFAYFLRTGQWWDPEKKKPHHLVNEKSFRSWESYCQFITQELLGPYERCDCFRSEGEVTIVENRYFFEPSRDNMLVYISAWGHTLPPRGRFSAEEAMANIPNFTFIHEYDNTTDWAWHEPNWDDAIRSHVAKLSPKPTHILLGAALWPNNFTADSNTPDKLRQAIDDVGMLGIWKTSTYLRLAGPIPGANVTDRLMCQIFDRVCLDLTWSNCVVTRMQYDHVHFMEPVYRIFNEDLLEMLGHTWPKGHERFDRMELIRPERSNCFVLPGHDIWNMTINRDEHITAPKSLWSKIFLG